MFRRLISQFLPQSSDIVESRFESEEVSGKKYFNMAASVPDIRSVKAKALQLFAERFNEQAAVCVYAPGRVNLIGEHTDYNEGFVLPMVNSPSKMHHSHFPVLFFFSFSFSRSN